MTVSYGWIITEDKIDDGASEGVIGPREMSPEVEAALKEGKGTTFYLRDDDGELYFKGRGVDLAEEWDDAACGAPLDNYGRPGYGCTEISWHGHSERDI